MSNESLDIEGEPAWRKVMKRLTYILTICLCLISVDGWAELTYKELQHSYEMTTSDKVQVIDNYLIGLYEGINAANLAYYMQTHQFLYCKPVNVDLNVHNIRAIIDETHEAHDTEGTIPASYLLFVGLKRTFPCF